MGTEAVGAYLWTLRKAVRKSRDALAEQFHTSRSQIERVEFGKKGEVAASLLLGITRYLGGDANTVADLLLDPEATAEQGRERAARLLESGKLYGTTALTPEQSRTVLERLRMLEQQVQALVADREPPE